MTSQTLLASLVRRGIRLSYRLKIEAFPGTITEHDKQSLTKFKAELVRYLIDLDLSLQLIGEAHLDEIHERFQERTSIMEYEGEVPREAAEKSALADVLQLLRLRGKCQ